MMENWDPFCEGPASAEDGQAMENWNPFEDPEMLELTGELAMESDDIEGLEAWLVQAKVMHLPWEKIQPKEEKLELLRSQKEAFEPKKPLATSQREVKSSAVNLEAAKETEEIKVVAQQKLLRKRLVPSLDLELSQQEEAILQKDLKENIAPKKSQEQANVIEFPVRVIFPDGIVEELKVNPCENGSNILLQLLPLKRSHVFPEDFAVLLPSGKALDFRKPLQAQGLHGNAELRIDQACFAEEVNEVWTREEESEDESEEHFAWEVEQGWNLIYWPLCVALAGFEETLRAIQKHPQVVVLGWNACHDLEVMQLTQEVSYKIGSDYLIVTGSEAPPEEWWPTAEEEAKLAAASECTLRGSRGPKHPKTSVLRIDQNGVPSELAPAILAGLRAAGCGSSLALVVVCRAFQSRRPVSVLHWCLQQEDYSHWRITVLPYSWDPRFVYLEDCRHRGDQVILEAQLLTEMNPTVWMEEEGQEAEIALSRVLLAHPQPERAHWHNGFYSKPFKERTRLARDGVAEHCEWFRWQKSTPLSAESHAKAAATRSQVQAPLPDDDDDEEPPPLVSHE